MVAPAVLARCAVRPSRRPAALEMVRAFLARQPGFVFQPDATVFVECSGNCVPLTNYEHIARIMSGRDYSWRFTARSLALGCACLLATHGAVQVPGLEERVGHIRTSLVFLAEINRM